MLFNHILTTENIISNKRIMNMQVLHLFPFDSTRKRMSIMIQHPKTKKIVLYTKGADSAILNKLSASMFFRVWLSNMLLFMELARFVMLTENLLFHLIKCFHFPLNSEKLFPDPSLSHHRAFSIQYIIYYHQPVVHFIEVTFLWE